MNNQDKGTDARKQETITHTIGVPENNPGTNSQDTQTRETRQTQTRQTRERPAKGPRYFVVNDTPEKEADFNSKLARLRNVEKPSGPIASMAQMMKSALGAGLLSSHVAFMAAGLIPSLVLSVILSFFVVYSLYLAGTCARTCCKRTAVPTLSYPDVAEATFAICKFQCLRKFSRYVRYLIDMCICIELFGACACYQLMVSFSLKQLIEDTYRTSLVGLPGYPGLRIYLLILMVPFVCISLIRHLQWLAPVSLAGNFLIFVCLAAAVYYSFIENPTFVGMTMYTSFSGIFTFSGIIIFSMCCVGVVVPVENNLRNPDQFKMVIIIGYTIACITVIIHAFFGYNAYREKSLAPITLNFPMELFPKILKAVIALNLYMTHGINFWIPFNLTFAYLKELHKPEKRIMMEYIYRACISVVITIISILFPDVPKVMSFIGCFCICNAAFIFPTLMDLLLSWERPGLGVCKWRLIRAVVLICFSLVLFVAGTATSLVDLVSLFTSSTDESALSMNYEAEEL